MLKWFLIQLDKFKAGRGQGLDYNRFNGKFRVQYPEGEHSQPFCWDVAKDYASLFHGHITSTRNE